MEEFKPIFWALLRVALIALPLLLLVPFLLWWERRLLGWMQDRVGPNRVGNITFSKTSRLVPPFLRGKKYKMFGLAQAFADGIKLILKEDITPTAIDRVIYFIAPALALFPPIALLACIPWGPDIHFGKLTPVADIPVAILYIFAVSSLGVYGIVLGGYASNNKYSLLGGLRSSAQLISYELAMGMSLAAMVLATGSLSMTQMVAEQQKPFWGFESLSFINNWYIFTPFGFISAVIFLICMVAETNRAPFDLPEAENELIAGYHTEYSSMKFACFFMGEYAAMLAFSGIFSTIFLGGYTLPLNFAGLNAATDWAAPAIFFGKTILIFTLFIWIRATLPRLRYDQLMALGWKNLLPLAVTNFVVVMIWIAATKVYGQGIGWGAVLGCAVLIGAVFANNARRAKIGQQPLMERKITMVDPNKGGA